MLQGAGKVEVIQKCLPMLDSAAVGLVLTN